MPWVDVSDNDPGRVDQASRAAIHKCWHSLPEDQQSLEIVEGHFRRLVDRAFRDVKDDTEVFFENVEDGHSEDDTDDV